MIVLMPKYAVLDGIRLLAKLLDVLGSATFSCFLQLQQLLSSVCTCICTVLTKSKLASNAIGRNANGHSHIVHSAWHQLIADNSILLPWPSTSAMQIK